MKFSVGDKVLLLHSGETAEVIEIINTEMVTVELEGISFPVFIDQIEYPYYQLFTQNKKIMPGKPVAGENIPPEKDKPIRSGERGINLTLLPVYRNELGEDLIHTLKLYLVNEGPADLSFLYQVWFRKELYFELKSPLIHYSHFYLHDLQFEQLNDNPRFEFNFSLQIPDSQYVPIVHRLLRPRAEQIFRKLGELRSRGEATFSFPVLEKYPSADIPESVTPWNELLKTPGPVPAGNYARNVANPILEVDMHIGKLLENWRGMSKFEILSYQLQKFSNYLDLALANRQHSLVVIHGVGKGRLRDEIHEILKNTPGVRNFINEYHVRYGYGATEIFFDYGKF